MSAAVEPRDLRALDEAGVEGLVAVGTRLAVRDGGAEHGRDPGDLVAVRIRCRALRTAEHADHVREPHEHAGLLPRFADRGVGGSLVRLEDAARRGPASAVVVANE